MKVLEKAKLNAAFDRLANEALLLLPVQKGDVSAFLPWSEFKEGRDRLALESLNVEKPPKDAVFPQTERMYKFKTEGQEVVVEEVYEVKEKRIVFGIRPCDFRGIECLDQVFFTKGYVDSFYQARRENTVFIANACYAPGPNCFCQDMGVDPLKANADVLIHEAGEAYAWEALTSKGEEISKILGDLLVEKDVQLPQAKPFTRRADYEGLTEKLKGMFEDPIWERLSDPCQNCGICTYSCPTCYCFDIQVKTFGEEGYRFRCWDSCMYREYTLMAGGHNPREASMERFRNRFLHKLEFFQERYGQPLCIGCGRCLIACPAGISIVKIMEELKEA